MLLIEMYEHERLVVKIIIWFSDTDFQKNDEGGRYLIFVFICILVQSLGSILSIVTIRNYRK
jgi:hypothetical protein